MGRSKTLEALRRQLPGPGPRPEMVVVPEILGFCIEIRVVLVETEIAWFFDLGRTSLSYGGQ